MRACTIAAALSLSLSIAACGEPEPGAAEDVGATDTAAEPEPDVRGDHLDVYLDEGIALCGGQLAAYDRFIERAYTFWTGTAPPSDFRISVNVSDTSPCRTGEHSCAQASTVSLVRQFGEYHELVHAIQYSVDGASARTLDEGLATALGADYPFTAMPPYSADPDILLSNSPVSSDYVPLGLFVRFLIDNHGIEAARGLVQALVQPGTPTPEEIERQFELAFGEPLAGTWAEFAAQPRCAYDFPFCGDQNPIVLPYTLDGLDCGDPDVLGYSAPSLAAPPNVPYSPSKLLHLQVDEPTWINVDVEHASVGIGQCGDCSEQTLLSSGGTATGIINFELDQPGTYVFIVRALSVEEPARLSIAAGCLPDHPVATLPAQCPE